MKAYAIAPRYFAVPDFYKMQRFSESVALRELTPPSWRDGTYPDNDFDFVQFLGMACTVNFYFTDASTKTKFQALWPECTACGQDLMHYEEADGAKKTYRCAVHGRPAKLHSGANAMTACLRRALDEGVPVTDPKFLRSKYWTVDCARRLFRGVPPLETIPMVWERWLLLRLSAEWLLTYFDDLWINVFRQASFRAFNNGLGAVEVLAGCDSFRDSWSGFLLPGGREGPALSFNKRAHLFAQMYHGRALSSSTLPRLKDPELLILPADYQLPKALASSEIGALKFYGKLADNIRQMKALDPGSRMVLEFRLATVELGEVLQETVNAIRKARGLPSYTKVELDYPLWIAGRNNPDPHPIVPTTAF